MKAMVDHFRPGCAANACSTVELSVSCRNLANMDYFSKSDPMCVLFVQEFSRRNWFEFGRTEAIKDNLNPEFAKKFVMNYFFEERQMLRFEIYDIDSTSPNLRDHDFIGRIEVSLGEIVSCGKLERELTGGPARAGTIIVVASEEIAGCKEEVILKLEAKKLENKNWLSYSSPYLALYKVNEDNTFTVVHRTETIKSSLNPSWKAFALPVRTLCGGDYNRSIMIRCLTDNENLIGECVTNLQDLKQASSSGAFVLINPSKKNKSGYKNSGTLVVRSVEINPILTFLDYVKAGTQLNCTFAIDFTASNGDPTKSNSLHYIHPYLPNSYQIALSAVGEIIQDYDSDKLFPVLGFGARLPPDGRISHEFFVNGHPSNPYCEGIAGVIDAYRRCIVSVQLYGPTNFAPIINHVARFAAAKRDGSEYFILLIITDGVITDMPQTKQAIVTAASLPLSIIIVGVGDADFAAMHELDGDAVRLSYNGQFAERDIVQFVPLRDFIKGHSAADLQVAEARLAKEVLAEIPDQFISYMKKNRIVPGTGIVNRPTGVAAAAPITAPTAPPSQPKHNAAPGGVPTTFCPPPPPYPGMPSAEFPPQIGGFSGMSSPPPPYGR